MTTTDHTRDTLLAQRYGAQAKPANILWNDTVAALLRHRSVRDYLGDPLPDGALETMVAAAQSASTSSNLHQWSVVAVTDPECKARLADLASGRKQDANGFIRQAPALLLWVADLSRNNLITREGGGDAAVHDYLDSFLMAGIDAALAAQNAVVAAQSLGLGTVYIGAMRNEAKQVAELIGLPQHSFVICGLVVGYAANRPEQPEPIRPRPPQQVVLHRERYDFARSMQGLEGYKAAFSAFREGIGAGQWTWKESVAYSNRMDYMDGRENLRRAVEGRRFKLY